MNSKIALLQNIFCDVESKWWIESADDLDENDHVTPNEYHGSFDLLSEAVAYMNRHFDYPNSYFVDKTKVRVKPTDLAVVNEEAQDRSGSTEIINKSVRELHAAPPVNRQATVIETRSPKMYYVQFNNELYTLKPEHFHTALDAPHRIIEFNKLKHLPTCVTRSGDTLYSNDSTRPLYVLKDGLFTRS